MQVFSQDFLNRLDLPLARPFWLLQFGFSPSANISDRDVTINGVNYAGLVINWGHMKPWGGEYGVFGSLAREMEVTLSNVPTGSPAQPFSANFANNIPQDTTVTLLLCYPNQSDAPQVVETFRCEVLEYDELICRLRLFSPLEIADQPLGYKISRADFPDASFSCVGKSLDYVIGSVDNVPLYPIGTGWQSKLINDIDATTTGWVQMAKEGQAGDVSDLPASGTVIIGFETVSYSAIRTTDNSIDISARGSNARPYRQGTVVIENMGAAGWTYGRPYHLCLDVGGTDLRRGVKLNGILIPASYYTVGTMTVNGQTITTIKLNQPPHWIANVLFHSHIGRRKVVRAGTTAANVPFTTSAGSFTSQPTTNLPDATKLGKATDGRIRIALRLTGMAFGATVIDAPVITISGNSTYISTFNTNFQMVTGANYFTGYIGDIQLPHFEVEIPLKAIDWGSGLFSVNIAVAAQNSGNSGAFTVDSVEWEINYIGGDQTTNEPTEHLSVFANGATTGVGTTYNGFWMAAPIPPYIPAPQTVIVKAKGRVINYYCGGSTSGTRQVVFRIRGNKLPDTYVATQPFYAVNGKDVMPRNDEDQTTGFPMDKGYVKAAEVELIAYIQNPDLTTNTFTIAFEAATLNSSDIASVAFDSVEFIVEYPQGNAEVITGLEIIYDGPMVTADFDGLVTYAPAPIAGVAINNAGSGYTVNDILSLAESGASGGRVQVTGVSAGIGAITLGAGGQNYQLGDILLVNGGSGGKVQVTGLTNGLSYSGGAITAVHPLYHDYLNSSFSSGLNSSGDFGLPSPYYLPNMYDYGHAVNDIITFAQGNSPPESGGTAIVTAITNGMIVGGKYTAGSNYVVGDILTLNGGNNDFKIEITGFNINGPVFFNLSLGSGYTQGVNYNLTGGHGTGAKIFTNVVISGVASTITLQNGGSLYEVGYAGVAGGNTSACYSITAATTITSTPVNNSVSSISLQTPGVGYTIATEGTTGGTGTGCTVNITGLNSVGPVVSVSLYTGGSNYSPFITCPTTGGTGTGCTIKITSTSGGQFFMQNPADVVNYLAGVVGLSTDGLTFSTARTFFTNAGYTFNGLVYNYSSFLKTLHKMQMEGNFAVWYTQEILKIFAMPSTFPTDFNLRKYSMIKHPQFGTKAGVRGTTVKGIINTLNLEYNRNWARLGQFYSHLLPPPNATSISRYGTREFTLESDFITNDTMATNIANAILARRQVEKRLIVVEAVIDKTVFPIEQFDSGILTHDGSAYSGINGLQFYLEQPPLLSPSSYKASSKQIDQFRQSLSMVTGREYSGSRGQSVQLYFREV